MTEESECIEIIRIVADDDPSFLSNETQTDRWEATKPFDGLSPSIRVYCHDEADAFMFHLGQVVMALGGGAISAIGAAAGS